MINPGVALDLITILKEELQTIKEKSRVEARDLKSSRQWKSVNTPPSCDIRALVWGENAMKLAWFLRGKWYAYDGTWLLKEKDEIHGVTHWMGTDWMSSDWLPPCGPGVINRLVYLWSLSVGKAQDMAGVAFPKMYSRNAQLNRKVSFYRNRATGEILTGMPGGFSTPRGFERIECGTVQEAERWSGHLRQWDNAKHERIQEERARVEGPIHAEIRSEMRDKMASARNNLNREFMRRALERDASRPMPTAYTRESYLHCEGFEKGR